MMEWEDKWLQSDSSHLLAALASICQNHFDLGMGREQGDDEDPNISSLILNTLGEYLAEMRRTDRAKMPISVFARCLVKFPPGAIAEADYATILLDYLEDNKSMNYSDAIVVALLGTVDFSSISQGALERMIVSRIPSYRDMP